MSDLQSLISKTLGVAPATVASAAAYANAKGPSSKKGWAPPRPDPMYSYTINVSRAEYGSVSVTASSAQEAFDLADSSDIEWYDSGDTDWGEADQDSSDPINQQEIDDWEDTYGHKFDSDGEPKCSNCESCCSIDDLTEVEGTDAWHCSDCYGDLDD